MNFFIILGSGYLVESLPCSHFRSVVEIDPSCLAVAAGSSPAVDGHFEAGLEWF